MKKLYILILLIIYLNNLKGFTSIKDSIYSEYLSEYRHLSIYLPKKFKTENEYPVIFATDGQLLEKINYFQEIDSLISNNIIKPLIIVGVHSNVKKTKSDIEYRNYEYIESLKSINELNLSNRFINHLNFFIFEVINYFENKYYKKIKKNYIFYGCSNGAGFGISLSYKYPNIFKEFYLFSPLGFNELNIYDTIYSKNIIFNIVYGKNEIEPFIEKYNELEKKMTLNKLNFNKIIYDGNHNNVEWKREFFNILINKYKN